jgi:hypothetical protein
MRFDVVWPTARLRRIGQIRSQYQRCMARIKYLNRQFFRGNVRCLCVRCHEVRRRAFRGRWCPHLYYREDWSEGGDSPMRAQRMTEVWSE